jgi:leader peptidase (prepilin peptidase)/N-methyltransferase
MPLAPPSGLRFDSHSADTRDVLLPAWLVASLTGVLGLVVGSFLNVVAARVPAGGSVVRPRSACPRCGHPIRNRDNLPLVSWLVLRGRCRDCSEPISVRYPLVEAVTGLMFAVTGWRFGADVVLPAYLFFAAISVVLTVIDLDTRRLPDAIVLPAYPVALAFGVVTVGSHGWWPMERAFIGGAVLAGLYLALWYLTGGRGLGYGDVKLAGLVGGYAAWLGWGSLVAAGFGAFLLGGAVGVVLMAAGRAGRRTALPFGPFMLAAAWLAVFAGDALSEAYLQLTGLS